MYKINEGNKGKENSEKHYTVLAKAIVDFAFEEDTYGCFEESELDKGSCDFACKVFPEWRFSEVFDDVTMRSAFRSLKDRRWRASQGRSKARVELRRREAVLREQQKV